MVSLVGLLIIPRVLLSMCQPRINKAWLIHELGGSQKILVIYYYHSTAPQ